MRIIFHYKSHLLRPKSHKRCPSIKLWFENIWNRYFVKNFKTSHPNLLILNGDNQSPTHKYDRVKIGLWRNYIDFVLFSAKWHSFKIRSPFYPVFDKASLLPTSQPLDQLNLTNHPTKQPDKLPQPTYLSWPPYHPKHTDWTVTNLLTLSKTQLWQSWPSRPLIKHHDRPELTSTNWTTKSPQLLDHSDQPNPIPVAQSHYMISRYIGGRRRNRSLWL